MPFVERWAKEWHVTCGSKLPAFKIRERPSCCVSLAASVRPPSSQAAAHHTRLLRGEGLLADLHPQGENLETPFPPFTASYCPLTAPSPSPPPCKELYDHMNGSLRGSTPEGSQVYLGGWKQSHHQSTASINQSHFSHKLKKESSQRWDEIQSK